MASSRIPPSPPNPSIAMSGMMNSSSMLGQIFPAGDSQLTDPHLTYSVMPVDDLYPRQWNVQPWEEILHVDYPYLAVFQFSVTYFSAEAIKENDRATLLAPDTKDFLAEAKVVPIGKRITLGRTEFYLARVTFFLGSGLTSPDVIMRIPNKLIFPDFKTEFHFMFSTDPVFEECK
jgi:hypothetical protein